MKLLVAGPLVLIAVSAASSAPIPYAYSCDVQNGFAIDPNVHARVGYITAFYGMGLPAFNSDLAVSLPFKPTHGSFGILQAPGLPPVTNVVGVIESLTWNGGVGDPLQLRFFVSQENAFTLAAMTQSHLTSNIIKSLGWWIGDYDQEAKRWFEQAYPLSPATVSGVLPTTSAVLVNVTPVPVKDGIDVNVYEVTLNVAPALHTTFSLAFANLSTKSVLKMWGIS